MSQIERSLPRLESEALRTFVAVAELGNVTRAADLLHRTQSAISVQVKRLEQDLGIELFRREPRGMGLTAAGEKLLPQAHQILQLIDRAAAEVAHGAVEGRVKVGIPDDYGSGVLAGILGDFAARHPHVDVDITCGFSTGFPDAVRSSQLDLAVYTDQGSRVPGDVLLREETVWVGSREHDVSGNAPLPLALFDRSCWWRDTAITALTQAGIEHRVAYSSESVAGIKAAVKAGLALGVLARSTVEADMRVLGSAEGLPALPVSNLVLIRRSGAHSPAMDAMTDAIRRGFSMVGRGA